MATATNDTEFNAADLIGSAGVGENGEKLVATLDTHYPRELKAALEKKENERLAEDLDFDAVAKIAGVEEVEAATVRGGERRDEDAWVTYVFLDQRGTAMKGAFPFTDLGKASSERHVSQRDSLLESPAGRDFLAAKEKADADAPSTGGDLFEQYEDMKATEVVAYVKENPERAAAIGALETALRPGDERPSVLKAVEAAKGDDGKSDGKGTGAAGATGPAPTGGATGATGGATGGASGATGGATGSAS